MDKDKDRFLPREPAGRISAIRLETSGRVQRAAVYVDDRLAAYALPSEVRGLTAGEMVLQAIRFLGRRDRSVQEVRQHLQAKGWDEPARERAVNRLRHERLLEDKGFAQKWIDYRIRTAPRSRRMMIRELEQKGVARETIHEVLAAVDESALALACAQKKIRQWQRYAADERRQRITVFLQRKGFPYGLCRETARKMADDGQGD
jgi:SOS response regulatory protein OraA/RecX